MSVRSTYKMRNRCLLMSILVLASSAMLATSTFAAEAGTTGHEGVSLKPQMLVQFGGFGITNSMLVTWIVAAGIIILSQIATRRVQAIPSGIQNFWEWLVEGVHNFLENIIGRDLVAKGFWFFATIFIFILFVNWFGLIPGIGTVGWGHYDATGNFHVDRPLLRGGNADLNMTTAMSTMVPWLSPVLPIPFYFLEVLVGFVQALVFMLLTAVFTMLIAEHQEGPERAH